MTSLDVNGTPLSHGQIVPTSHVKAWIARNTDIPPLSRKWRSILAERGEIQVDGSTYFFEKVEDDHFLVRQFNSNEVTDFHRDIFGGRLHARAARHFCFQNCIFIAMVILVLSVVLNAFFESLHSGLMTALLWSPIALAFWVGRKLFF